MAYLLSVIVMGTPLFSYTPDLIRALRGNARCVCQATRKLLFLYRLWCPAYARWSAPVQSTESDSQPATVPSSQPSPGLRFATWNVHSLRNLQLPPLYMPSLQTGLTTAPRSMLASPPVNWRVWIGSCVLLPA